MGEFKDPIHVFEALYCGIVHNKIKYNYPLFFMRKNKKIIRKHEFSIPQCKYIYITFLYHLNYNK